jgi:hypothetical protein
LRRTSHAAANKHCGGQSSIVGSPQQHAPGRVGALTRPGEALRAGQHKGEGGTYRRRLDLVLLSYAKESFKRARLKARCGAAGRRYAQRTR